MAIQKQEGQLSGIGKRLPTAWPWRLVLFSFSVFILTLLIYVALAFLFTPYLERQISEKDMEIEKVAASVPQEEQERFLVFYSQLANLKSLLDNHVVSTPLFDWLEANTNSQIFYSSLSTVTNDNNLILEGVAESYDALTEQLEVFNQSSEIKKYSVQQSSRLPSGRVQFRVDVLFNNQFFRS
jgi:hypothetical protein